MKKYQEAIASVAFLTLMLSAGLNIGFSNINSDKYSARSNGKAEQIMNSFEQDNYDLWKSVLGTTAVGELINKDDFKNFVASRQAVRLGRYEEAINLTKNLELRLKNHLSDIYLT